MIRSTDEVFVLYHEHYSDAFDAGADSKIIGVYATESAAERARECARMLEGFSASPEGFTIKPVRLNVALWEGYLRLY